MHSTIGSVRPFAALNQVSQGRASARKERPRCELVVEVYVPDPPPVDLRRQIRHGPRPRTSRWLSAAVVIGLHVSVGAWLWWAPTRLLHPPLESMVLLAEIPALSPSRPPIAIDLPRPELSPTPPSMARFPELPQVPTEMALSVSPSTDVLIDDANAGDIEGVARVCRAGKSMPAPSGDRAPGDRGPGDRSAALILLVRVEKDGRVSDSRIEAGSGEQRLDEAATRCFLAHGVLTPRRLNGAPVASWQRVHWAMLSSD